MPPPEAERLFLSSLASLHPSSLLSSRVEVGGGVVRLVEEGEEHPLPPSGLLLVGAGKAVLGLAAHLVALLGDQVGLTPDT